MELRALGGIDVSAVGVGCNAFGDRVNAETVSLIVHTALDAGVNFFDTADVYGSGASEELLGQAVAGKRHDVIVASKFGHTMGALEGSGAAPAWIRTAVEDSLRRLDTDYIDLYQQHVPDPDVPLEATLETLTDLIEEGKVRQIGSSNFSATDIRSADEISRVGGFARFVSTQHEWSLLSRSVEESIVPTASELGLKILPYLPLAAGVLTGKYRPGQVPPAGSRLADSPGRDRWLNDSYLTLATRLEQFATERGLSILELAMSWLGAHSVVASVIAGVTRPEQVLANAAAFGRALSPSDLAVIDTLTQDS